MSLCPWKPILFAALAGLALVAAPAFAQEEGGEGVEAGVLTCKSVPGSRLNLLIHSSVDVTCVFESTDGKVEHYKGDTGIALGLDLNWKREETLYFTVISLGSDIRPGAYSLAGIYGGGKASITAGGGIGATALIGGSADNVALQPLGFEHSTGVGLSGGLSWLNIEPDTSKPATGIAPQPSTTAQ